MDENSLFPLWDIRPRLRPPPPQSSPTEFPNKLTGNFVNCLQLFECQPSSVEEAHLLSTSNITVNVQCRTPQVTAHMHLQRVCCCFWECMETCLQAHISESFLMCAKDTLNKWSVVSSGYLWELVALKTGSKTVYWFPAAHKYCIRNIISVYSTYTLPFTSFV